MEEYTDIPSTSPDNKMVQNTVDCDQTENFHDEMPNEEKKGQTEEETSKGTWDGSQNDVEELSLENGRQKVYIVGGGFAGVYTALKLSHMSWKLVTRPEIIVVDQKDKFVLLPLLYEYATGLCDISEVAQPYSEIFSNTPIKFIQDTVVGVDLQSKQIHLAQRGELSYDLIVLAVGAEPVRDNIEGAKEFALSFYTLDDALDLQQRIQTLKASEKEKINVVIAGGSYSGVELACTLLDYFGHSRVRVILVDRSQDILKTALPDNRIKAEAVLISGGVEIITKVQVEKIEQDGCVTACKMSDDAEAEREYFTLDSDLVIVTAGSRANSLLSNLNLEKDEAGKIITGKSLLIKGYSDVFALGDNSVVEDNPDLLPTAQVAFQASEYAAWNIWAALNGDRMLPFRYHRGELKTLGAKKPSLTPFGLGMKGPVGSLARRLASISRESLEENGNI